MSEAIRIGVFGVFGVLTTTGAFIQSVAISK